MPSQINLRNVSLAHYPSALFDVSVRAGRIIALSLSSERGATEGENFDLHGRTLIAGIDDSHLHLIEMGRAFTAVDLRNAEDNDRFLSLLRNARPESNGWIRGQGWDITALTGDGPEGRPTSSLISDAGHSAPAVLGDFTGHSTLVNKSALTHAGIDSQTPDPIGGRIDRYADGSPTGLLFESASALVLAKMPAPTRSDLKSAITLGIADLLSRGITAFTEPGIGPGADSLLGGAAGEEALEIYQELAQSGELPIRTTLMLLFSGLGGSNVKDIASGLENFGKARPLLPHSFLGIDQVKIFADGVPRSRTSWMKEPYDDGTCGHMTIEGSSDVERLQELDLIISEIHSRGWQAGLHSTGDATSEAIIESILRVQKNGRNGRHYLIHGNYLNESNMRKMSDAGIGLNTNPLIRWLVGQGNDARLGIARARANQPLQSALNAGISLALSSDAPVSEPDWKRILVTAHRRDLRDLDASPSDSQKISLIDGLRSMTEGGAYQNRTEGWRGRIEVGYAADLVLLDRQIDWNDDGSSLLESKVQATLVAGECKYGSLEG